MTDHLARSERNDLADLLVRLGDSAPTLCDDWTTKDLLVHLLVRERSPLGAPGIVIPALSRMTDKASAEMATRPYAELVDMLRNPSKLSPGGNPVTDKVANTLEFYVHHEDVRRAQPSWEPRELPRPAQDELWRSLTAMGKLQGRRLPVPAILERSDTGEVVTLRKGPHPAKVTGLPSELAIFLTGRDRAAGLEFTGPDDAVTRLRSAKLSF